jgi:hypothetical protein
MGTRYVAPYCKYNLRFQITIFGELVTWPFARLCCIPCGFASMSRFGKIPSRGYVVIAQPAHTTQWRCTISYFGHCYDTMVIYHMTITHIIIIYLHYPGKVGVPGPLFTAFYSPECLGDVTLSGQPLSHDLCRLRACS